jgi:nucleoside-diphosphate-sugar epimerase
VDGSKKLAEQAAKIGVRRLIFLSSIGVNGLSTNNLNFFSNMDMPMPIGNYAFSKYEAEKELMKIAKKTKLEVVIIRPPLVYGKLAPGNIKRIIKIINLGIPLPFGKIKNSRSFIGIDNLIDLLIRCIDHPEASGKIFLASDGEDLSTPELIKLIASSMGRKANLFPFPIFMLKLLGSVFGRREEVNRLIGSLRIDNSYTKETLNWIPPINVEEGIKRMVQEK